MAAIKLKRGKLSDLLISQHTHAEYASEDDPEQIVYLEKDVVELILKIKANPELLNDFDIEDKKSA